MNTALPNIIRMIKIRNGH